MVDFRLTEEQMMIREMAREFSEEEILPTLRNGTEKALTQGTPLPRPTSWGF